MTVLREEALGLGEKEDRRQQGRSHNEVVRTPSTPCHAMAARSHLLSLEPDNGVVQQVSEIQFSPLLDDVPVFAHEQPADVGEEEATAGVVRVCVRLRVLVVHAVVSAPLVDVILQREHSG